MNLVVCFLFFAAVMAVQAEDDKLKTKFVAGSNPKHDVKLDETSVIAFSAARTKLLKGHKQAQYSLSFDHVYLNEGGGFDPVSGMFTAPMRGIYEFSFSGGALPHKKLSLQLMKNHFEVQTLAYDGHRKKNPHVQSQNILLEINVGERVWVKLASSRQYGVAGVSSRGFVTTFAGRLLNKRSNVQTLAAKSNAVRLVDSDSNVKLTPPRSKRQAGQDSLPESKFPYAFSVARTTSILGQRRNYKNDNSSRSGVITFDKDFVNIGGAMNLRSGEFEVPQKGLYYFSYTVGKYPRMKLSVSLVKNENEFQVMVYDESLSNKRQMQSQSLILHLDEGDKVWLKSFDAPGYAVYSNLGNYIMFSGYILSAL